MAVAISAIKSFFVTCVTCLLSLTQIFSPYFAYLTGTKEEDYFEKWSVEQEFTKDYCIEIEKKADKDFKILNLTDIQLSAFEPDMIDGQIAYDTIDKLVKDEQPDLITVTGDNAWSTMSYLSMIKKLDSYGIPWAPVMGNHDGQGCLSEFWCAYQFTKAENCLFKFGPEGMGYGNYIINITENGKIIHSLFMMDTHSGAGDTEEGKINIGKKDDGSDNVGYDHFWKDQLTWYEWAVKGISEIAGKTVQSSVYMHIPVYEYRIARDLFCDEVKVGDSVKYVVKEEYKDTCFGEINEGICSAEGNNGFFALAKELGSTKDMIVGHDHVNNLSVVYEGIRLSYGEKCGPGCYWTEEDNGGSVLTVVSDGTTSFRHVYVDPAAL